MPFCAMLEVPFLTMQRMEVAALSPLKLVIVSVKVPGAGTTRNGPGHEPPFPI